ncbi:sensor histidine kinase [Phenylobacterium terrae]|uniref:histidine kinase n=1 Tax=Phenylobacterium terrae TaxID=2665495 RepID=A0ABW4N333_9CAUL
MSIQTPATSQPARPPAQDARRARAVTGWSAGWLAAVAAAAAGLWIGRAEVTPLSWLALAVGAAPALVGLLVARRPGAGVALVLAWAACAVGSSLLTGGLTGPLAFWCLAPLAAAAATGEVRLAALGGAAALIAAGLAAMAAISLPPTPIANWTDYWLRLLSIASLAGGLAAGVVLLQRRQTHDVRRGRAAEVRMERLLAEQPFVLVTLDAEGRVQSAYGPTAPGLDPEHLPGRRLAETTDTEQAAVIEAAIRKALADGEAEARFTPAGADQPVALVLRRAAARRLVGALRSAAWQIGREAELEEARAQAEARNAGKSRFLANMSHELRTPLNAIMGFSDIMRARLFGPMSDKYAEYAELIHESGGHLLDLINDVLDMSKIEAERFELAREEFDAREAVSAVLRLMRGQADRARIQLRGVLPKEPLMVDADRRALKQITLNLISNALRFTPAEGQVTVALHEVGEAMELVVSDTGAGIGPEDLKRIGRPYEQAGDANARAGGTGLGLSLVRAFAELHGGEMIIESRVGEGTQVTVSLPVLLRETPVPAPVAPVESQATIH